MTWDSSGAIHPRSSPPSNYLHLPLAIICLSHTINSIVAKTSVGQVQDHRRAPWTNSTSWLPGLSSGCSTERLPHSGLVAADSVWLSCCHPPAARSVSSFTKPSSKLFYRYPRFTKPPRASPKLTLETLSSHLFERWLRIPPPSSQASELTLCSISRLIRFGSFPISR